MVCEVEKVPVVMMYMEHHNALRGNNIEKIRVALFYVVLTARPFSNSKVTNTLYSWIVHPNIHVQDMSEEEEVHRY